MIRVKNLYGLYTRRNYDTFKYHLQEIAARLHRESTSIFIAFICVPIDLHLRANIRKV